MKRVLLDLCVVLSIFIAPWWCPSLLVLVGLLYYPDYFESICAGFMIDSLYGVSRVSFHHVTLVYTYGFACLFIICVLIRNRLSFFTRV